MAGGGNRYRSSGKGWFLMHHGKFYSKNDDETSIFCERFTAKGSIVRTRVDMNNYELSYKINEGDWKVATKQLKKSVKYRFAVTMHHIREQIELL